MYFHSSLSLPLSFTLSHYLFLLHLPFPPLPFPLYSFPPLPFPHLPFPSPSLPPPSLISPSPPQAPEPRTVIQFHFAVWPDFGVPEDASSMLKFVRRVRSHVQSDHGPMVVHCSAGVGRTGTFIAIDVMLQKMAMGEALNIQEFVCQMRAQRNHMVQTNVSVIVCV